jgi:hypothetical protein
MSAEKKKRKFDDLDQISRDSDDNDEWSAPISEPELRESRSSAQDDDEYTEPIVAGASSSSSNNNSSSTTTITIQLPLQASNDSVVSPAAPEVAVFWSEYFRLHRTPPGHAENPNRVDVRNLLLLLQLVETFLFWFKFC